MGTRLRGCAGVSELAWHMCSHSAENSGRGGAQPQPLTGSDGPGPGSGVRWDLSWVPHPGFQSWAGLLSEMTRAESMFPLWGPIHRGGDTQRRDRQCRLAVTSAELVVVRLQQGLGHVPLLTAGRRLTRALLLTTAAVAASAVAAAAAGQVSIVLNKGEARGWSVLIGQAQPDLP